MEVQQLQTGDHQVDRAGLCQRKQPRGVAGGKKSDAGQVSGYLQKGADLCPFAQPQYGGIGSLPVADKSDCPYLRQARPDGRPGQKVSLQRLYPVFQLRHGTPPPLYHLYIYEQVHYSKSCAKCHPVFMEFQSLCIGAEQVHQKWRSCTGIRSGRWTTVAETGNVMLCLRQRMGGVPRRRPARKERMRRFFLCQLRQS